MAYSEKIKNTLTACLTRSDACYTAVGVTYNFVFVAYSHEKYNNIISALSAAGCCEGYSSLVEEDNKYTISGSYRGEDPALLEVFRKIDTTYLSGTVYLKDCYSEAAVQRPTLNLEKYGTTSFKEKKKEMIREYFDVYGTRFENPNYDVEKANIVFADLANRLEELKYDKAQMKDNLGYLPAATKQKFKEEIREVKHAISFLDACTIVDEFSS